GAKVVDFRRADRTPVVLGRLAADKAGSLQEVPVILRMERRDCLVLAGFLKLLERVGAHDFEQTISRVDAVQILHDQRLRDQRQDLSGGLALGCPRIANHGTSRSQREASGEYTEAAQYFPLRGAEQAIAPVQCRAHGLVTRYIGAAAVGVHAPATT